MDHAAKVAKMIYKGDVTSIATEQLLHTIDYRYTHDHAPHISKVTKKVADTLEK